MAGVTGERGRRRGESAPDSFVRHTVTLSPLAAYSRRCVGLMTVDSWQAEQSRQPANAWQPSRTILNDAGARLPYVCAAGGQGRDRSADLPLFRRAGLCVVATCGNAFKAASVAAKLS